MPDAAEKSAWALTAAEGFRQAESSESLLVRAGRTLRTLYADAASAAADGELREAFKTAYIAKGGNPNNVNSYWSRVLYQYGFPGAAKTSGKYYKLNEDGSSSLDAERNARGPTPPPATATPPKHLRDLRAISVPDAAVLAGFPVRMVVAAGSGGGKTTIVRQYVKALLDSHAVSFVYILTGTLASQWEGLGEDVEVEVYDPAGAGFERAEEIIEQQKALVRQAPSSPASWARPLFVFDDIGDQGSAKRGKGGELLDSFFMTLRNFNISVIALNQQQNNFLTPARRDGATCILVGDLTNKQREAIFDTLAIPPDRLTKKEFVSFCADFLGRTQGYRFLAYCKEQRPSLFLTAAELDDDDGGGAVLAAGLERVAVGGGGSPPMGKAAFSTPVRRSPRSPAGAAEDDEEEAAAAEGSSSEGRSGGKVLACHLPGGIRQKTGRDLYTTYERTITPLLNVLQVRHRGATIWEPCVGLGNIRGVLEAAGFSVVGTDLYSPDGTLQPDESFIETEADGVQCAPCAVPEGVDIIVTNPPFSEKLAFIQRFYELGIPTYCLLPLDTLGVKAVAALLREHGVEQFVLPGGVAASCFRKESEGRDVHVGVCAWFGFNTRPESLPGRDGLFFLEEAQ